jgi:hypothetical protein
MKETEKPSLGWDLAGYGDSGSALCRADRKGDRIAATILCAPFICRPRHTIGAAIDSTVDAEVEMLRRFAKIGNTYLDVPVDLQLLARLVDHLQDQRVLYYWQLVKRPVDYVFKALEPLACNLGYAVARTSHILGRLAAENAELKLGDNLFETYPAATLQLVWDTNKWTEAKYKGGNIIYRDGRWQAEAGKKKSTTAQAKEERKNAGLATLANNLGFRAAEGSALNDDEFDAIACAMTGCIPDFTVQGQLLADVIRKRLATLHGKAEWITKVEPPDGYVVFDRLPAGVQVHVRRVDCPTPDALYAALCSERTP